MSNKMVENLRRIALIMENEQEEGVYCPAFLIHVALYILELEHKIKELEDAKDV